MIRKNCQYCGKDSYSSYNDPDWRCPYCGEKLPCLTREDNRGMCVLDFSSNKRVKIIQNTSNK